MKTCNRESMKKINNHTLFLIIAFLGFTVLSWGQTDLARWDLTSNGTVSYSDSSVNVTGVHSGGIAVSYDSQGMNTSQWNNPDVVHYRYFGISVASSNGSPVDISSLMFEQETFGPQNYTIRYYISPDGSLPADDGWGFLNTPGSTILINNESISSNIVKNIPINLTLTGNQRLIIRFYANGGGWTDIWRIKANTLKITAPANSPTDLARWNNTNFTPTEVSNNINASNITIAGNASMTATGTGADSRFQTTAWSNTINTSNYVEVSISPDAEYQIDLDKFNFDINRGNQGNDSQYTFQVRYSKDNFATFYTSINNTNISEGWTSHSADISSVNPVLPGQTVRVRVYAATNNSNRQIWIRRLLNTDTPNDFSRTPRITGIVTSVPIPADLEIDKTVNDNQPDINDTVTFTITVTNNGPNNATGVIVTDQLPNGYAYVSHSTATGSYNQGTGIWSIGNLADGNTVTLTITATVLGSGTHNNTASVTANESDSIPTNNSDTVIVTPNIPTADLKITKTVDDEEPSISENVTFTLTVTNDGPDNATGVVVTDQLPNGYTYVNHSTVTGSYNQGTGIWTIGNLTNGNSATLTITATVLGSGNYTNTAIVTANEYDPVAGNNTDSETPLVGYGTADLEIKKLASHYGNSGQPAFFYIIVRNNGPNPATNVVVQDNLNNSWNFVSPSANHQASHGTMTASGTENRNIEWEIPYISNGGVAVLVFRAVNNYNDWESWPQGKNNTATITSMDQTDPVPGNNSQTVTSVVFWNLPELSVTKSVSPEDPYIGEQVQFTVTVEKTGSDGGPDGLQVLDKLPLGYTYVSHNATTGTYNPGTGIWNVRSGWSWSGTETLTITATVNAPTGVPDEYKNVAAVMFNDALPNGLYDVNVNNNMDSVTIPTPIFDPDSTDLQLTKTVDEDEPMAMDDVVFTITVFNAGSNPATGVTVTDFLPSGYDYVSSVSSAGSYNPNTGIWTVGNLAISASVTLEITATVLAYGDYENTAFVSANQTDNTPSNNSDSVTITPDLSNTIDLEITKEVDNTTPDILENVVFTIEVENVGDVNATGVLVTDVIPSGYNFVSATGGATYNPVNRTVSWNAGSLEPSDTASFTITTQVRANGNHTNTASVEADQLDNNPGNNTDSASVIPNISNAVDLKVTQSASTETPNIGNNVIFTITAENNGPFAATGVLANTLLANGFQFISATPSIGSYNSGSGVWTIGSLAVSASATLTITAEVLGEAGVAYLSIAEITGNEIDFDNNIINNVSYSILSPNGQQFLGCDINAENPVFTEDFGSGLASYAPELTTGRTNLTYQQGQNIEDGEYTVAKNAQLGYDNWQNITDPSGDPNGYFMIINADLEPHEFFRIRITLSEEFCANTRYNVNFKVINVNSQVNYDHCTNNEGGLILPEIGYFVQNNSGEVLGAGTSGEIPYNALAEWIDKQFVFISGMDDQWVELVFFNKAPGGCGNDLAIDDIVISACMTPPIRLNMEIDTEELEVCGGETVTMQVVYVPDVDYQWPPEAWTDPFNPNPDDVEYQWQRSEDQVTWVNIIGETTDTYIIENFQEEDQAYYRLLYAQVGNINKTSCRFPSDDLFPVFNATPVLGEIESEVDEEELCVGAGPFQFVSEYDFSDYDDWDEEYPYFLWESLNPSVATINQNGILTPITPGSVTIKYTVHSPKAVCIGFTQKTFIIRDEECTAPPAPKKLITNPHIRQRTK
jgi:uncharacterized repeat protein (TIGR01451 family)